MHCGRQNHLLSWCIYKIMLTIFFPFLVLSIRLPQLNDSYGWILYKYLYHYNRPLTESICHEPKAFEYI